MYLKSLEITGFKSFAKKATLGFTSPITSIVGPNGSGKSNVAEAFRFVLGEQSIKSMRGKRGEDLIYNGGKDGSRVLSANVKVVFDNRNKILNVDFDEVVIERTVNRDGTNDYYINGSLVRLKDVIELLAHAHIGASGHHIISQGEADRILNANIRERKEMIEDALGLKIYQYKKIESQRKLQKTEENMKSVESLRREIAPHLKFLKKQVEKVEKVHELREELRGLYREYFSREEIYLSGERGAIERDESPIVRELTTLESDIAHARRTLEESKGQDKRSTSLISIEKAISDLRREKDGLTHNLGKIEGEISVILRNIDKEKARFKALSAEEKLVSLKEIENLAQEIDKFKIIENAKELLKEVKSLFNNFIGKHRSSGSSSAVAGTTANFEADLRKELKGLEAEKSRLEISLKKLENDEATKTLEYNALKDQIEREKDSNRDAEKNIFKIIARQNELRGVLNNIKGKKERLNIEEASFKRELEEAHALLGREGVDYNSHSASNSHSAITEESRDAQHNRLKSIEKIKIRIEDSGTGNGADIMKEYKDVEERDAFLMKEVADLEVSKKTLLDLITELEARIEIEFKEGILKINMQFQEFFALMFGGGSAELTLVAEKKKKRRDDDLSAITDMDSTGEVETEDTRDGIEINVSLPRKKIKGLMMLSGGERALTSIALLFAVSQVNPPPFIILDETDAALDEANSKKYGDMIANLSKYSQLILITHNRETMSRAGVLYGVTMGADGASKLLSIQFEEAVRVAK